MKIKSKRNKFTKHQKEMLKTIASILDFSYRSGGKLHYGNLGNLIFQVTKGKYTILADIKQEDFNE